jgi:hypothetical protein
MSEDGKISHDESNWEDGYWRSFDNQYIHLRWGLVDVVVQADKNWKYFSVVKHNNDNIKNNVEF